MHTRKSWVATLLLTSFLFINAAKADSPLFPQDGCEDGSCPIPTVNENNQPVYAIVSPVGYRAVEPITQVPRLDSLDGKKIFTKQALGGQRTVLSLASHPAGTYIVKVGDATYKFLKR